MADQNQSPPSQEELLQRALLAAKGRQSLDVQTQQEKDQAATAVNVMEKLEPAQAGINAFARSYTLGASEYAKAAGGYLGQKLANQPGVPADFQANLNEARQESKDLEARNPVSSTIGGFAGSMMSPATKVAKGAGIARQVVQGVASSGAQGFLESGAQDLAGKLADAETSAVIGGAANLALGAAGKAVKAFGSASGAEKSAVKALSPSVTVANEIKELDKTLVKKGQESVGRMLLNDDLVRPGDTIYQTAERIKAARGEAGALIGGFLADLDDKAAKAGMKMQNPAQILRDSLAPVDKFLKDNANASQVISAIKPRIDAFVESYATSKSPSMQLANLHQFQSSLRNAYEGADSVTKEALKKLESGLSKKLEAEVERISKAAGKSTLASYQTLKTKFNMLRLAEDAVEGGAGKVEAAKQNMVAKNVLRLPALVGMFTTGNPSTAAAAFVPEVVQLARERSGNMIAGARNALSDVVPKALEPTMQAGRAGILEALRKLNGE